MLDTFFFGLGENCVWDIYDVISYAKICWAYFNKNFLGALEQIYLNFCNFVELGPLGSIIYINVLTTNSRALQFCQTKSLVLLLKCLSV